MTSENWNISKVRGRVLNCWGNCRLMTRDQPLEDGGGTSLAYYCQHDSVQRGGTQFSGWHELNLQYRSSHCI